MLGRKDMCKYSSHMSLSQQFTVYSQQFTECVRFASNNLQHCGEKGKVQCAPLSIGGALVSLSLFLSSAIEHVGGLIAKSVRRQLYHHLPADPHLSLAATILYFMTYFLAPISSIVSTVR